ncbi:formate/nitrite transporter family protein [Brachybacterium sp. GPGPB12]|uniref:formate/nitrite transporter family protein n=1 Tax=Brachybacterium sp. GPGPB12 TaxID=3023517 RepID=UPI0031343F85
MRHWGVSAGGNLIGSVTVAPLILLAGTHATNGSAWGMVVLDTTQAKVSHDWHQAFFLGVLANFAVCLAVWAATAGKTVADKILAVAGPVALFVATGFEHSVANMFMLPMGLLVKYGAGAGFWEGEALTEAGKSLGDYSSITVGAVIWDNLIPVVAGQHRRRCGAGRCVLLVDPPPRRRGPREELRPARRLPRDRRSRRSWRRAAHSDRGDDEFRI